MARETHWPDWLLVAEGSVFECGTQKQLSVTVAFAILHIESNGMRPIHSATTERWPKSSSPDFCQKLAVRNRDKSVFPSLVAYLSLCLLVHWVNTEVWAILVRGATGAALLLLFSSLLAHLLPFCPSGAPCLWFLCWCMVLLFRVQVSGLAPFFVLQMTPSGVEKRREPDKRTPH